MYTRLGRRTLLSVVRTYGGVDHWTYALQTVQVDVRKTTRGMACRYTTDVRSDPRRTVTVWQENPIFTKCPIVVVYLDLGSV
jgi:hypothetical protein